MPTFPLWKTITVGTHTIEHLAAAIRGSGGYVPDDVLAAAHQHAAPFATAQSEADLALVPPIRLGLRTGGRRSASHERVLAAGSTHGLAVCSFEIALQLLLAWQDFPSRKIFPFAMDPFPIGDSLAILVIARPRPSDPRCLGLIENVQGFKPNPVESFIFVRPRWKT